MARPWNEVLRAALPPYLAKLEREREIDRLFCERYRRASIMWVDDPALETEADTPSIVEVKESPRA
jgi:hypothetical protein